MAVVLVVLVEVVAGGWQQIDRQRDRLMMCEHRDQETNTDLTLTNGARKNTLRVCDVCSSVCVCDVCASVCVMCASVCVM